MAHLVNKKKRVVIFDSRSYKVRSDTITVPDFEQISRFAALIWLNQHTYAVGYTKPSMLLPHMDIIVKEGQHHGDLA